MNKEDAIDKILEKLAIESWRKGKDGLFLSIEGNFGAALEPAKQAILQLIQEAKIEELEIFDKHGLTVMDNKGEINYIDDRLATLKEAKDV